MAKRSGDALREREALHHKPVCRTLDHDFERARQLVMDEPGVLRIAPRTKGERRTRTMYRIPEGVVQRILRRSTNPTA